MNVVTVLYRHTTDMGQISGFGGGYEEVCQQMLQQGAQWLAEHSNASLSMHSYKGVYGVLIADSDDAKALEAAVMKDIDDCTGAMHHAVMRRLQYIAEKGWDSYKRGPWKIDTFEIEDSNELYMKNFRYIRDGYHFCVAHPGKYRRLSHAQHGTVMSTTHMERITCEPFVRAAQGRVFITGLGIGMVLEALLAKPEVTYVRVVEIDADVIALVGKHYKAEQKFRRLEIVNADCFEYRIPTWEQFDYGWHDIWNDIDSGNLPAMARLVRRYARRIGAQFVWSRPELYKEARRYRG